VTSRTESDGEVYVTAPETPSAEPVNRSFRGKGKGKARAPGVDGVLEEDSEGEAHAEAVAEEEAQDGDSVFKDAKEVQSIPPDTPLEHKFPRSGSSDDDDDSDSNETIVEIVEPKAINADYDESPML
jgi:hypothetical protein